jgi:hypothetical protein
MDVMEDDGFGWRFTGVYGFPQTKDRHKTWTLLRDLYAQEDLPWLAAGDFNEILFQREKEGGLPTVPGTNVLESRIAERLVKHEQ